MKTHFKVALFLLGEYLWGVLYFLGLVSIGLVSQYLMRLDGIESTPRIGGSFVIIMYAGYHSMGFFEFFQSWHLPRRQFFFANAVALFAMVIVSLLIGPTLAGVLGTILPVAYDSILEPSLAILDVVGVWAVLWSLSVHTFIVLVFWLLRILHYRGWLWKSIIVIVVLAWLARLSLGVPLGLALWGAWDFFFVGMIDDRTNIILASMNLTLGALMCAGVCYSLLRRTPMR